MAGRTFKIHIVTPEDTFFDGESVSLMVPGSEGYLGVLVDHAPLVTPLGKGRIELKTSDKKLREFDIEGGFMEVSHNEALILAENISEVKAAA